MVPSVADAADLCQVGLTKDSEMGPLDALWHLLNLFGPALGTGLIAAVLAKLLWRRDLKAVPWRRLALWGCAAAAGVTLAGLVVFGRDGRMATYGAMVAAIALALWWRGFMRPR
jgi:hypothetical protein